MEIVGIADKILYQRTQRFAANYMIIDPSIKPVLLLMEGFKAAPAGQVNGPYYCGTLGSLKVYVSPRFTNGEYVIGVNGSDLMSSVAVYAPYMAVVPTMLLQGPDGATTQGWSTMYDLKPLNENLAVRGIVQ